METMTEKDGSLGGWGGKKYEGLGSRDVNLIKIQVFTQFRREKSQLYYGKKNS